MVLSSPVIFRAFRKFPLGSVHTSTILGNMCHHITFIYDCEFSPLQLVPISEKRKMHKVDGDKSHEDVYFM